MSEELVIYQGEDVDIEITIQQVEGPVLDMADADEIVFVVHDGYGNVIAKFKQNSPPSGWDQLEAGDLANGVIGAKLRSEHTEELEEGRYYAEVRIQYVSDASDDSLYDIVDKMYLFSIRKSVIVAEALL